VARRPRVPKEIVLYRVRTLDTGLTNARAFRCFLEELRRRRIITTAQPHLQALGVIRAGLLRGVIGCVMSCLDSADRRGNRASVGQVLELLSNMNEWPSAFSSEVKFKKAQEDYNTLVKSDIFERSKRLRTENVAHLLDAHTPTADVEHDDIFELDDEAERLGRELFEICGLLSAPHFVAQRQLLDQRAKLFWDTYIRGMKAHRVGN
jgi:hypothetical protein